MAPEIFAREGGVQRVQRLYLRALCDLAAPGGSVRLLALNDASLDDTELKRSSTAQLTHGYACGGRRAEFVRRALELSGGCDRMVCGHVGQAPVALLAMMVNRRLRYYVIAHGIEVWKPLPLVQRLALRCAARVLCVSDYTRRELLRHTHLPAGRTAVVHNALDPAFVIAPGVPRRGVQPVILSISRITDQDREKGLDHLIQALPAIRSECPGASLRIIGRGNDLSWLAELSRKTGVADAVEFLGFVNDEQLTNELRACSLFALPSRKEGFGLVFVEAMAHGRPCIGARAGGVPEIITSDTGSLVPYGDIDALAKTCIEGLARAWDESAILERARAFSYPVFRDRLAAELDCAAIAGRS